jgi:aspartyl-tRNA(Asn)/glutamyl-tRNA(Gln) amidotransferase subunit A
MSEKVKLNQLTVYRLLELIKNKQATSLDVLKSVKDRIKQVDAQIKAYIRLDNLPAGVPAHRAANDEQGQAAVLEGIPISIKDNICTKGYNTECCSRILQGFKPPYQATVIKKLISAGAYILEAKTNMDEFAFGSSTENSCFGPTRNPWDLQRVVGGSSGGSAAAVAADEAIAALGSDTGGSIRQPACFCGVVGLKPTYGRVSRFGLIAFASSLDQIGPITKDVKDCALILKVISGFDPLDSTSVNISVPDYSGNLSSDIKGIRIGVPREYFIEGIDKQVKKVTLEAIDKLKQLGAEVKEINLAHTEYAVPVYYIVATAEASSNLARFDGVQYGLRLEGQGQSLKGRMPAGTARLGNRLINMYKSTRGEGFGQEAKRRIILGTYALSYGYYEAYYLRALKVRTLIKQDFDKAFEAVDCIVTPTSPSVAFKLGEKMKDPLKMYLSDIYTISANLAGIPAISIPCGFSRDNLPVGMQILANSFNEEMLLRVAYAYEQNTDWHLKKPKI